MQKAHNLLEDDPHCQVAQVAAQCGFNDSNYFSKQYKKHFGISPIKTKKQTR
jgi:transcriptional regulator GlxA family with amidase domain